MKPNDADGIRTARSVQGYRLAHQEADDWATDRQGIRHSTETQDRVFRLAEQLRAQRDWVTAAPLFPVLRALDTAASSAIRLNEAFTPRSAAAAALVAFSILFGKPPPLSGHDWPTGVDLATTGEAELATLGLRAAGCEPIVFDGTDPAAYLWVLYEMRQRQADCDEVSRRHGYAAPPPRGLALVPAPAVGPRNAPAAIPLSPSRQLVGVGG